MSHPQATCVPRRRPRLLSGVIPAGLATCALLAGCSTGYVSVPEVSPARIPALEAEVAQDPDDLESLTELGAAYREAGRADDARIALEHARELAPDEPLPVVLLGLTYEDLEAFARARAMYEEYLELVPDSEIRGPLEGRIQLMRRHEFQALVRDAVAREGSLDAEPAPTTVAVFPFRFEGSDAELRPLGHALGAMVSTDLAQVGRLTLLERMHLDQLMNEIELGEGGLVDPATAARSGRLLGAGLIVQGRLGGSEELLDLEAAAVRVTATEPDVSPVSEQDALERLFDMEKGLVLGLIDAMGITLTAAERERVLERRTRSLRALLAYGRGLEASQRGDHQEAEQHFTEAVEADPGFDEAQAERDLAGDLVAGVVVEPGSVIGGAVRDIEIALPGAGEIVGGPPIVEPPTISDPPPVPGHPETIPDPPEVTRDPPEVLGGETVHPNPVVVIDIILRRPGGGGGGR